MAEYLSRDDTYECLATGFGDRMAEDIIKLIPIADVQPVKRGKWIHFNNDSNFIFCSECTHEAYWDTDYGQQLFDYCPYCGAVMLTETDVKKEE